MTNVVPIVPASRQVFSRLSQYRSSELHARSSAVKGISKRLQIALGVKRLAVLIDEVGLQPPHHDLRQLLVVGKNVSREALVVQQFE